MKPDEEKVAILLVDDRRDKLMALETILEELDERLVMVTSGEDALRALLREDFAVIVLDVNMPGMDGFETAALIRQRKRTEHTPIIFVTGININETHVSRGYQLGAVDYIFAPVEPVVLRSKVSVFTDLFRRSRQIRRQEEALRHAAEARAASIQSRLENLLNRLNVGIFQIDLSGHCLDCNPAFLQALGAASRSELDKMDLSWIREPADGKTVPEGSIRLQRKDGSPFWASLSTALGYVEGLPVIEGVLEDVTVARESREALRRSEARYRSLLGALPQLVWTAAPDGSWDYVSGQWQDYSGCEKKNLLGSSWIKLLHPDDSERAQERWRRSVEKVEEYDLEYRLLGKDGTYRWFKTRAVPISDEPEIGGEPGGRKSAVRWFGTCTDIEDQKQAEVELERAGRLKDEFLTMLSHELRNPLNAINSAVQIAMRNSTPEQQHWSLDVVRRQVRQLVRLIDDLLDVSRLNHGKISLRKERMLLDDLIKNAESSVGSAIRNRSHQLIVSCPAEPVYIFGDPARLEQIVVNLLTNAVKYTEKGGYICLSAEVENRDLKIQVRDSGMGIAPEMLGAIFDLFSQADRSLDRSQGGLGIGLTVSRRLAELHGGSLTAASDGIGKGASFTLTLPEIVSGTDEKPPEANHRDQLPRSGLKVLLVDDHADTLEGTALYLRDVGCKVRTCSDGFQAVSAAREFRPEVVLLDIGLPGLNGYEVARHIRNEESLRNTILIAVSGYGQEMDKRNSKESGFDMHLVKPLDFDQLFPALQPILNLQQARADSKGMN